MSVQTTGDVVITGAARLCVPPKSPLAPARWAAKPAKLARMDRLCALALVATDGALLDAGLTPSDPAFRGDRTAVVLGTAFGCHATNEDYYRGVVAEGPAGASPRLFAYTLPSSPVGEISIHYGATGPAAAVTAGLTAGLDAITVALREVRHGRADRVLVSAAEVATPLLAQLLGGAQPLADGAAALVLERTTDAAARGATPRGRVLAACGRHAPGQRAQAVAEATRRALKDADVGPGALRCVLGAPTDVEAIRPLGIDARADVEAPEALGAAPLLAVVRALTGELPGLGGPRGLVLVIAGDPEGGGAAAIIERAD